MKQNVLPIVAFAYEFFKVPFKIEENHEPTPEEVEEGIYCFSSCLISLKTSYA